MNTWYPGAGQGVRAMNTYARNAEHEEAVNADSFLDIVASVVSVMIIMVMMTGLKIKNTPPDAQPTSEVARAGGDLVQKQQRRADAPRRRGEDRRGDAAGSSPDGLRQRERDILALAVTGLDQQLRGARQTGASNRRPTGSWPPR